MSENFLAENPAQAESAKPKKTQKKKRAKRVPLGNPDKLRFPAREGFHRRVFNDKDGRIQAAMAAGYEPVRGDDTGGPLGAKDPKKLGSIVKKEVGNKTTGVLMEIPIEYYEEDQKAKQDKLVHAEQAMQRNTPEGLTGEIKIQHGRPPG